jgi:hypothetical protein
MRGKSQSRLYLCGSRICFAGSSRYAFTDDQVVTQSRPTLRAGNRLWRASRHDLARIICADGLVERRCDRLGRRRHNLRLKVCADWREVLRFKSAHSALGEWTQVVPCVDAPVVQFQVVLGDRAEGALSRYEAIAHEMVSRVIARRRQVSIDPVQRGIKQHGNSPGAVDIDP